MQAQQSDQDPKFTGCPSPLSPCPPFLWKDPRDWEAVLWAHMHRVAFTARLSVTTAARAPLRTNVLPGAGGVGPSRRSWGPVCCLLTSTSSLDSSRAWGWPFQPAGMGSQKWDAGESGRDETTGRTRGKPRWHVAPRGQAPPRKLDSGLTTLERTGMFLSPAKASSHTSLRQPWVTEGLLGRTARAGRAGGTRAGAAEGEHT